MQLVSWKIIWPLSDHHSVWVSYPGKSSDQHLTTSVTCLSYRKTIWPLSDHLSEYLTNIWPQMQLVSFPGKPSDHHLTITLYGSLPWKSFDQHLTTLVTCLFHRKTIRPLSDLLSEWVSKVSDHLCDLSLSLENHHLTIIWPSLCMSLLPCKINWPASDHFGNTYLS